MAAQLQPSIWAPSRCPKHTPTAKQLFQTLNHSSTRRHFAYGSPSGNAVSAARQQQHRPLYTQATSSAEVLGSDSQQNVLNEDNIREYIADNPQLCQLLRGSEAVEVERLLDGVINVVFKVQSGSLQQSAVIKQALPYVRAVGESFPLSRERMNVEAAAMQLLHACCPAHIPQLYSYDPQHSILAMQCLPPPHQKLLYCIRQGQILPGLATQLAELLASYLSHTSQVVMTPQQQVDMQAEFANVDIVEANERVVLLSPFTPGDSSNRWSSPQLDSCVHKMWSDPELMSSAAAMLDLYRTQKESLIHNDLHAGNLLAAPGSLYLIDWEFATFGPMAFDIGCLLGNLMLAVLSLMGMDRLEQQQQQQQQMAFTEHSLQELPKVAQQQQQPQQDEAAPDMQHQHSRKQQAMWLLEVMADVWSQFLELYPCHLAAAAAAAGVQAPAEAKLTSDNQQQWQQQLLADSCGFAGCCLIRLTIGLHHYPDIQSIKDDTIRVPVERACLELGQKLLLLRSAHVHSSGAAGGVNGGGRNEQQLPRDGAGFKDGALSMDLVQQLVRDVCGAWLH